MIVEPGRYLAGFAKAGADVLTVHVETCPPLHRAIQQIKELGMKAATLGLLKEEPDARIPGSTEPVS